MVFRTQQIKGHPQGSELLKLIRSVGSFYHMAGLHRGEGGGGGGGGGEPGIPPQEILQLATFM